MRLVIGVILGIVMLGIALVSLAGGIDMFARGGWSDDVAAAGVIGVLMLVVAVLIFVASIGAHRRRKARARGEAVAPDDPNAAQAAIYAVGMATLGDDFGGDDS